MPAVGLGRLGGAGRSTVPIACGDDELGTPAQPANATHDNRQPQRGPDACHTLSPAGSRSRIGRRLAAPAAGSMGLTGSGLLVTL